MFKLCDVVSAPFLIATHVHSLPRELDYKYLGEGRCIDANKEHFTRISKTAVSTEAACRDQCTQRWSCIGYQPAKSSTYRSCVLFGRNMVKENGWTLNIEKGAGAISSTERAAQYVVCYQKLSPIPGRLSSMCDDLLTTTHTRIRARTYVLGGVVCLCCNMAMR